MKFSPVRQGTWWLAVVIGVLGILGRFAIPQLAQYSFALVVIAFLLLVIASLVRGL
ncbi:MAG TPA: hypothetical protein VI776_17605 [Anaerolineales bacterium]|jgi:hypothetical protein|nr:hypothetical protein [Anaerolineales bacterium]